MAREQEYDDTDEEETEEEEEETPNPTPAQVKKVVKKASAGPAHPSKQPPVARPQVQYIKIPVFESQAQQIFYDTLLAIDAKLAKVDADLELMKKYLPQ